VQIKFDIDLNLSEVIPLVGRALLLCFFTNFYNVLYGFNVDLHVGYMHLLVNIVLL